MPDTAKPHILLSHEMLAGVQPMLEGGYVVHRLWEHPDRLAFLRGAGRDIRAIVHAGEMALPGGMLSELPHLGLIACVSVGYDGVDTAWARSEGIAVTHAAGTNAEDVADFAIGLMISAWRGLSAGEARLRGGLWNRGDRMRPIHSLRGKTVGIVGLGHIGEAVAGRAEAFGMHVKWWGPREKPEAPWPRCGSLVALAKEADVLIVASRADASNRGMISAEVIEALGPRSLLVNVARGSVVDEDALIAALKDGRLGMAALDVFAQEPTPVERWTGVPNCVLTPHMAGATLESVPQMVAQCLENLRRFFHHEPLLSPIPD
jgi:lactate dehydrogenase-like 2-hydroxyacid dehydrogenase